MAKIKALTFTLSGRTAFFKKPDVNSFAYFTYNSIHKVALLGILGAVIGLNGHNQREKNSIYPEFYEKLNNLKISIVPLSKKGYFDKKIQVYNNTTGFDNKDSKRLPCTLNVKEQWLHNVSWQIYILEDDSIELTIFDKLKDYFVNRKCEYIPYLGNNNHAANISDSKIIDVEEVDNIDYIHSLFKDEEVSVSNDMDFNIFEFKENLPTRLTEKHNQYIMDQFTFTNRPIENYNRNASIYKYLQLNLYFF